METQGSWERSQGSRAASQETNPRRKRKQRNRKAPKPQENAATWRCSNPPPPQEGAGSFQTLMEDITCSVCLDDLQNPVYIACGHTFCRDCITKHWATPQQGGFLCPECRASCPRHQIAPDYRLMSLISKIQMGAPEKPRDKESLFPEPGSPIRLVWTDDDGALCFDESVLKDCFMKREISGYPVYLLSIIGEKRRGKSFLMNYIMRALESQERGEEFSMGANDDPLLGFEWRSGTDSATKGIWIWSRPFILGQKEEKVAVYILDTEGSLDIEGDRETCIKLSTLSMMLSSNLIFNVASSLKETDMDYMEMYLHMGEEFPCPTLQFLDILIRDWHNSNCGRDAAGYYINQQIQRLQKRYHYPRVLWDLQSNYTRCFLFPHPGKGITGESLGRLQDMDEDFQASLRTYVEELVTGVTQRIKTDQDGDMLTCSQIPPMFKTLVDVLGKQKYGFSTPMEMFYIIKNQKTLVELKNELRDFLDNQPQCVLPSTLRTRVSAKSTEILVKFEGSLFGQNHTQWEHLRFELQDYLKEEEEKFCAGHTTRLKQSAIGLVTAGVGVYGFMGAVAARGAVAVAAQPVAAVGGMAIATNVAAGATTLLRTGMTALASRFFR